MLYPNRPGHLNSAKTTLMKSTEPNVSRRSRTKPSKIEMGVGALLVILGLVAVARPTYATMASTVVFGWIFMLAGLDHLVSAIRSYRSQQFIWRLLLSLICLGTGVLVFSNVLRGALALTLILGMTIFLLGIVQVILALWIRPAIRWTWILTSGLISIVLGILVWSAWPYRADWIIGFWVGLHFIGQGLWMMGVASPAIRPSSR